MVPNLKELYSSALTLKENIRQHQESWYENWPPLAADMTGESVKKAVSPLLFNFVSWMLGYSDDPDESQYVDLDEKLVVKVVLFSICQDIVYNNSRGKTQTPKSLALSIRQISGCSAIIDILKVLGHCVSLPTTMSYNAAMAQVNIDSSNLIPKELVANKVVQFTTVLILEKKYMNRAM